MVYRRSTQSTSSASLATHPREVLDLNPVTIIVSLHKALKSTAYEPRSDPDPGALESLSSRLQKRVQSDIRAIARGSSLDPKIDWEASVFKPIIATFDLTEDLHVCKADAEYIFLLAVTLLLAYELLILSGKSKARRLRSFLARAFKEYFVEPEVCSRLSKVLGAERRRLAEGLADMKVVKA
ncbi:hypothetical protein BDW02DRAFT_510938, partial [Decorospora gaudefroyi]